MFAALKSRFLQLNSNKCTKISSASEFLALDIFEFEVFANHYLLSCVTPTTLYMLCVFTVNLALTFRHHIPEAKFLFSRTS